jgi:hypothetical protein
MMVLVSRVQIKIYTDLIVKKSLLVIIEQVIVIGQFFVTRLDVNDILFDQSKRFFSDIRQPFQ